MSRRSFNSAGAVAAAGWATQAIRADAAAPNERVRLGIIGVGNRGSQLMSGFLAHDDCEIVAAADVYAPYLERAREQVGTRLELYDDYHRLLDRQDIDAIIVATPDHWHALQMIESVNAEKDVYVEKPLSTTVVEGRRMVQAAEKTGRIVQVGLHRRSMHVYHQLADFMRSEKVGKITVARAYRLNNMYPEGIGSLQPTTPTAGLNWERWLGPRPLQPYQDNIAPYKFRWWLGYSSQMGNWGVHYCDAIRWMLGVEAPTSVVCMGGNYAVEDDRTIPDTAEAIFELPAGGLLIFGQYEASSNPALAWGEIELRGTQGTVYSSTSGFQVITERGGQFQDRSPRAKPLEFRHNEPNDVATANHARNFLDCVKTRNRPNCPVEEGHRSTAFAHLANISLATKSRLEWDAKHERFINNDAANNLLHYEYRAPYKLPT